FQLHLTSSGAGVSTISTTISALRFFFKVTLDRSDLGRHLSTIHRPRKAPVVLSPDEMARFLEAAPGIKYKAAFSVAYGAGLPVSEVASLKISDIHSNFIHVVGVRASHTCQGRNIMNGRSTGMLTGMTVVFVLTSTTAAMFAQVPEMDAVKDRIEIQEKLL